MSLSDGSSGPANGLAFSTLGELRKEHVEVVRATRAPAKTPEEKDARAERIRSFMQRAHATGRRIENLADRDIAQGILDYWAADLLSSGLRGKALSNLTTLAQFEASAPVDISTMSSPYMGLRAFEEKDAAWFFGRKQAIVQLCKAVAAERLVVMHGPSGSGKSSLAMAGLLPQLKSGLGIPGSERWRYFPCFSPGTDPLTALLQAVSPADQDATAWIKTRKPALERNPGQLSEQLGADNAERPVFLVVDQLEELFTLSEDVAAPFLAALQSLTAKAAPLHRVLLIVREDYLARLLKTAQFAALSPEAQYMPPALDNRELRAIIEEPATKVGLKFRDGIVADLVSDVIGEPTALPLLQFTLSRLWDLTGKTGQDWVTWDIYKSVGRPSEALKRTADEVFDNLGSDENKRAAQRIFLDLVRPAGGGELVRRRMRRQTLMQLDNPERINTVLEPWVTAGLLRKTEGAEGEDDRFEVAHETLLRNWPRLVSWLSDKKQQSEKEIQLINTARLWQESKGQRGFLLNGDALKEARQFVEKSPELRDSPNVQDFIRESARNQSKVWWIAGATIAGLVGAALVSLFLGYLELQERNEALTDAYRAQQDEVNEARRARYVAEQEQDRLRVVAQSLSRLVAAGKITAADLPDEVLKSLPDAQPSLTLGTPVAAITIPYSREFLGIDLPVPALSPALKQSAHENGRLLNYFHFSVALNAERRMAIFAATNFDRKRSVPTVSRPVAPMPDPGISALEQLDPAVFGRSRLRGYFANRSEVAWGGSAAEIERGESAVNYLTNLAPQDEATNRAWSRVERWMLLFHNANAQRVTFFSGPVFRADDKTEQGTQIPQSFWKVAVSRRTAGSEDLVVDAFLVDAARLSEIPEEDRSSVTPPYQIPVAQLEAMTGLDFGRLKQFDSLQKAPPAAGPATVYLQFMGGLSRDNAKDIAREIDAKNFKVPGEESITNGANLRDIRYFYVEDRAAAERLALVTQSALAILGYGAVTIRVQDYTGFKGTKAAKGTMELWLDLPAPTLKRVDMKQAPKWLTIAYGEVGVVEQPGGDNPRIREYHSSVPALAGRGQDAAWSSSFLEWVMNQAGITGPKSGLNRSWLNWGRKEDPPTLGCVAVFWRTNPDSRNTSVGLYVGEDKDNIFALAGNITNSVSIMAFPRTRYLECRMPS